MLAELLSVSLDQLQELQLQAAPLQTLTWAVTDLRVQLEGSARVSMEAQEVVQQLQVLTSHAAMEVLQAMLQAVQVAVSQAAQPGQAAQDAAERAALDA